MPRAPAKKAAPDKKPAPPQKASRMKEAAIQVAADVEQVRVDMGTLLASLDHLGVEELREVSDRALQLIAEKGERRSLIGEVAARAASIGETITGLFARSEPVAKRGGPRKAEPKKAAPKKAAPKKAAPKDA